MGSVKNWLESQRFGDIALVLEFDGCDLVLHSATHDVAGIATAWAGTDWTVFKPGLRVPSGELVDKIEPFDGTFAPQSMNFHAIDPDGAVALALLGTNRAALRTRITADIDCDATAIPVESTAGFGTADVYCGLEAIAVEVADGTNFTATARGRFSTYGTATADRRGRPHRIDTDTDNKPAVTSAPTTHINRIVSLWITRWDGTAWATRAESTRLWSGRIKGVEDNVGELTIKALDLRELLNKTLLTDQLHGTVGAGLYMGAWEVALTLDLSRTTSGTTTVFPTLEATLAVAGTYKTHEELAGLINEQFQAWSAGGAGAWPGTSTLSLERTSDGRYKFVFTGSDAASTYTATVGLAYLAWELLADRGWGYSAERLDSLGRRVYLVELGSDLRYTAETGPRVVGPLAAGSQFTLGNTRGTWHDQPNSVSNGFVIVGGGMYEVNESAGTFTVVRRVDAYILDESLAAVDATAADGQACKQVWYESGGTLGHILYEIAVSTGTADYADADRDIYPESMGCAVPYGALDRTSWLGLGTTGGDRFTLVLEEPKSFRAILSKALTTRNAHVIQHQGVLEIVRGIGATSAAQSVVTLDTSNTASEHRGGQLPPPTRTPSGYGADAVINKLTLKYHRLIGGSKYARTIVVNAPSSQTDNENTRGLTLEADGFYGGLDGDAGQIDAVAQAWVNNVVSAALAYCARAYTVITRTFDFRLFTVLYPGATCLLTDQSVIDPDTGTRGVTNKTVWAGEVRINIRTGVGIVYLLLAPNAPTIRAWAPSAMVDHSAATGGYVAATKVLTLLPHHYSGSAEAADASRFPVGSNVLVTQVSDGTPLQWIDVVAGQTGNTVTLTTGLSSPAWDAALYYVLTLADDAYASAAELAADTFIGIGHAWGPPAQPVTDEDATAPDFTHLYRKISGAEASDGYPLSVHLAADLARWVANMWDHGTAQVVLNEMWATERAVTGDTFTLIAGPIPLPVTSIGKAWKLSVLGRETTSEGYVRITTSENQPTGVSDAAMSFAGTPTTSEEVDVTDSTNAWCHGAGIIPERKNTAAGMLTWVTIEARASAGGETVTLRGLTLREVPL